MMYVPDTVYIHMGDILFGSRGSGLEVTVCFTDRVYTGSDEWKGLVALFGNPVKADGYAWRYDIDWEKEDSNVHNNDDGKAVVSSSAKAV